MEFTLLTRDQIWGKNALDALKKYGTKVAPTDLTVLLGGQMLLNGGGHTPEGALTTSSWTQTVVGSGYVSTVHFWGNDYWNTPRMRMPAVRPVILPADAPKIKPDEIKESKDVRLCEYGEYPQMLADNEQSQMLEVLLNKGKLEKTGKAYTFDEQGSATFKEDFKPTPYPEYKWKNQKYIRVLGSSQNDESLLSDGRAIQPQKPYWVKVERVKWLMDKSGFLIAHKGLLAGIPFDVKKEYDGNFKKTVMKRYLDTYFAREIGSHQR